MSEPKHTTPPRISELIRQLEKREGARNGTFATGALSLSISEADELLAELRTLSETGYSQKTLDGGRSSPAGALAQGTPDNVQGAAPGLPAHTDKQDDALLKEFEEWRLTVDLWDYELAVAAWMESRRRATLAPSAGVSSEVVEILRAVRKWYVGELAERMDAVIASLSAVMNTQSAITYSKEQVAEAVRRAFLSASAQSYGVTPEQVVTWAVENLHASDRNVQPE